MQLPGEQTLMDERASVSSFDFPDSLDNFPPPPAFSLNLIIITPFPINKKI